MPPEELGVHRAVGGALPTYVSRPHDELPRAAVTRALAGESGIAVLVSDSSSGKTRACYEALHWESVNGSLANNGWRVWPTIHPTAPRQVLAELPQVGPHTVVWLNEAQRYLLEPPDEIRDEIAAELRSLLADRSRGPVLVLGTLWPRYWKELTRLPELGERDQANTRMLLDGHGVQVPDTFSAADRSMAAASGDPQLTEAVRRAEDGAVTQYLAGAPDLLQRYELSDRVERAVSHAAMDARRMGHGEWLPADFLRAAALAYLDARTTRVLDRRPTWFDEALAELTRLGRADTSVLIPAVNQRYRLEDYLDQHGRRTRVFDFPPQVFWDAVARYVTDAADLTRMAVSAAARFRLRTAVGLYRRVDNKVGRAGVAKVARHVDSAGDPDGAERLVWELAAVDGGAGLSRLVDQRENDGRGELARDERLLRRAVELGHPVARRLLAVKLEAAGRSAEAERLAVRAVELGDDWLAMFGLASSRGSEDDREVERLLGLLLPDLRVTDDIAAAGLLVPPATVERDHTALLYVLARVLRQLGDQLGIAEESMARLRFGATAELGEERRHVDPLGVIMRGNQLLDAGDLAAADELLRGFTSSLFIMTSLACGLVGKFHDAGDLLHAEQWAAELNRTGDERGYTTLVRRRTEADDVAGAEEFAMRALADGSPDVLSRFAGDLRHRGDVVGAERCARLAEEHDGTGGTVVLAELAEDRGDHQVADVLARRAAGGGNNSGLVALAESRLRRGDVEGADVLLQLAVNVPERTGLFSLSRRSWELLDELRQPHNLLATGLRADGSVETVPASRW